MDRRKPSHRGGPHAWSSALLTIFFTLMTISLDVRHGVVAQAGQGQEQLGARVQEDILQRQTDDRQWVMPARNYASTRYSKLDQITTENVKSLQLAWSFSTGVLRGHEAAPLVVNDTMYIVTPWPNILYALDLTQPGGPSNGNTNHNRYGPLKEWPVVMWSIVARHTPMAKSSTTHSIITP